MSNTINVSEYIKPDSNKNRLFNTNEEIKLKMAEHRGIEYGDNGKIHFSARKFAGYVLKRRISLFRLDSGVRYVKNQKKHNYEQVSDVILSKICMKIMDELDRKIYEMVNEKRILDFIDRLALSYRDLDIDNKHLLFPNGIFDIENMTFDNKFETEAVLTYQMGFAYDPDAECPNFKKALARMFPDDTEAVTAVLQEMMGYTFLYDSAPADTLFYLYGKGRNGKSIISFVMRKLYGECNIAGVPLAGLSERFNLSALLDKRICICPENSKEKILDTSTLKALTGREAVKTERKYADPVTVVLNTKIIVNSNHYLRTDDQSTGFWERVLPIPFKVTFLPVNDVVKKPKSRYLKRRDTRLEQKIEKELSGIFNWSMEGLAQLNANAWTFTESQDIIDLKNKMIAYCKPVSAYISHYITQGNLDHENGKPDRIRSSEVFQKFIKWAEDNALEITDLRSARIFRKIFLESLEEQGISVDVIKISVEYYVGIRFK